MSTQYETQRSVIDLRDIEDGSYKVSNGTIQITNGSLVIMGIGATFQKGSFILGQKVESGSITIAATREIPDGKGGTQTVPVFICKDGTARVDMGGITLKYNEKGIYYAKQYLGSRTENVDTGSSIERVTYSSYEGTTSGVIISEERGKTDFGYDCIFLSDDLGITFGEASDEDKNNVSHRKRALEKLKVDLDK